MTDSKQDTATEARPTTGGAIPILRVTNLETSIDYYVARLGFAVEWRSGDVASVRRDRTAIMLCEGRARSAPSPPARELPLGIARMSDRRF